MSSLVISSCLSFFMLSWILSSMHKLCRQTMNSFSGSEVLLIKMLFTSLATITRISSIVILIIHSFNNCSAYCLVSFLPSSACAEPLVSGMLTSAFRHQHHQYKSKEYYYDWKHHLKIGCRNFALFALDFYTQSTIWPTSMAYLLSRTKSYSLVIAVSICRSTRFVLKRNKRYRATI